MIRSNITHLALAVGAVAVATAGCGRLVEKATEKATEKAVEQAIENDTGGDVDVDFGGGEIRVESDEGDVTFTADENGVQIDGTDADGNDFSADADENGFEAQSGDGEVFTGEADGDGGFTVEGSEGEAVFATSEGFPEQWPDDVPRPDGLSDVTGTYFADGDDVSIVVTGTASGDLRSAFDRYTDSLVDAGFDEESTFTQGDEAATSSFARDGQLVTVSIQSDGSTSQMVIALAGQ